MTELRKYLSTVPLLILTFALGLGTFIQILDTSIANVGIPYIAGDLGVSPNEGTWVITSFAVSNAIVLPLTGWLSSRFGGPRVFFWSTALFSIASWLCGLAWSLPSLIAFRIIQGATGGALIPLSQSLLLQNYPDKSKGLALGFWAMVVIVAPIVGPILGGWITENYGWRWIFYINIPLGFLSSFLTYSILGNSSDSKQKTPLDVIGLGLLILAVGSLQIMLDKGNDLDWFGSPFIVTLAVISFVSFCFFFPWNYLSYNPVVNFSAFRYRNFLIGTILSSIGYFIFFGSVVLVPLWLQTQMGYTPFWAGVAVAPIGIIPLFISIFVGKYVNVIDARWMVTLSFSVFAYTFFLYSTFNTDVGLWEIMWPRMIQGIGVAFFFVPLVAIALSEIPEKELSHASGVFNFVRLIAGGGFGTSISVTLWNNWHQFYHSRLGESTTIYNPATDGYLEKLQDLGLNQHSALKYMDTIVTNQAYMLSLNDIFWLAGWLFIFLLPFVWLCHRPQPKEALPLAE